MIKVCSLDFLNKEFFEADVKLADGRIIINAGEKITQELVLRLYFKEIYIDEPLEINEKQVFVSEKTENDLPRELLLKKESLEADAENEFIRAKTPMSGNVEDEKNSIHYGAKNINQEDYQYSIPSPDKNGAEDDRFAIKSQNNSSDEDNQYSIKAQTGAIDEDNQYSIKAQTGVIDEDNQYSIKSQTGVIDEDNQYSIKSPNSAIDEDNQYSIKAQTGAIDEDMQYSIKSQTGAIDEDTHSDITLPENIGREDKQYSIQSSKQNADYQETSFIKTKEPQSTIPVEYEGISKDKLLNQDLSDKEAVSTEPEVMYKTSDIAFGAEQSKNNSQEADFAVGKEKEDDDEIQLGNLKFDKKQAEQMAKLAVDTGKLVWFGRKDLDDLRDAALNCNIGIVKFNDTDLDNKNFEICKAAESADMAESEGKISDNAIETIRMYPSSYESKGFSLNQTIPHYNIIGIVYFYQKMLDETGSKQQVLDKMLRYGGNKFNIFVLHKFIRLMRETNDQPTT